jgi:hypothetical protein
MTEEFKQLRQQYQPETIKMLFITEAVQPGNVFFYRKNSNVFRAVKEAFSQVFGGFETDEDFLVFFKENGCYVDYLCPVLINGLPTEVRQKVRKDGIKPLSERLALFQPKVVVTVMKVLEKEVLEAIQLSGIASVQYTKAIAFPAHSKTNADKCVKGMIEIFNEFLEKNLLVEG